MKKKKIVCLDAPEAIGPYSQAIETYEGYVFVSGQLPIDPVSGEMPDDIRNQTRKSLDNIRAILKQAGCDMDSIVKTTVLLKDINDFVAMNEIYAEYFEDVPPARACYQVVALPKGASVEIEAIAVK